MAVNDSEYPQYPLNAEKTSAPATTGTPGTVAQTAPLPATTTTPANSQEQTQTEVLQSILATLKKQTSLLERLGKGQVQAAQVFPVAVPGGAPDVAPIDAAVPLPMPGGGGVAGGGGGRRRPVALPPFPAWLPPRPFWPPQRPAPRHHRGSNDMAEPGKRGSGGIRDRKRESGSRGASAERGSKGVKNRVGPTGSQKFPHKRRQRPGVTVQEWPPMAEAAPPMPGLPEMGGGRELADAMNRLNETMAQLADILPGLGATVRV